MTDRMTAAQLRQSGAKPKRKPRDLEGPIHRACIRFLRAALPEAVIYHPPNEVPLSGGGVARAIAKAKGNGMLPGFPDILVYWQGRGYCLEVKAKGGTMSAAQERVRAQLEAQGIPYAVVRSVDDVRAALAEWGVEGRAA